MLCGRCKIALGSPILPSEASDVGVLGGEAVSGAGVSVLMLVLISAGGGGGVLCGVAAPDDLPPGVGGGVGDGDGGTLGGGVISPSGGRMIAVPAPPLC